MSSGHALEAVGLGKTYGKTEALAGVDLSVDPGQVVGLLGPNGAGKSTFVKIASGLTRASSGTAAIFDHAPGSREANATLGYLAELFRFPYWLTALELLGLHQRLVGSEGGPGERERLLETVGLATSGERRIGEMSKGMQQRLGIAQALIGSPRLLILDEPTSALDPVGRRLIRELIIELRSQGVAVLLNSHLLGEVERVCDRFVIISKGRVVAQGSAADLEEARGVTIETATGTKLYPDAGREDIPRLVAELVAAGEALYSVNATGSTLEDAYLRAVGGETS
jgi:ABC-2 type transport system ATP-binding protein